MFAKSPYMVDRSKKELNLALNQVCVCVCVYVYISEEAETH